MEFDQLIFQKIFRFYQRRKKVNPEVAERTVLLSDIQPKLTLLARALTGESIEIAPASRDGGWQDNVFYLPSSFSMLQDPEENVTFYIYRTCYLYVQKKLAHNWNMQDEVDAKQSILKAEETSAVILDALFEEFQSLRSIHDKLKQQLETESDKNGRHDFSWLYGHWMKNNPEKTPEELQHISEIKKQIQDAIVTTEIEAKASDEVQTIQVDKKAQEDFVLTHNFEKAETAEEFTGVWRDFDGDDSLKDDAEALSELNLKHTVRVDDPTHSVYKAEFVGNTSIADSKDIATNKFFLTYPEWNFSKRAYKIDFCKVYPENVEDSDASYYRQTLEQNNRVLLELRKRFARMDNVLESIRRQPNGHEYDLDAVTDMYADIKSRHTPDERIYLSQRKRKTDLSILFLLDLSLSSDGYTAGNRVLDVEKQVVILFGEVLNEHEVNFEIGGFSSKTRNLCSYNTIKAFDDSWEKGKFRVGAVQPSGYTRIGPAIRHAGAQLKKQESKKKWMVLLSDGKPNDYDKYEGNYGVQDVKQALRELNSENINTYAVAIEDRARYYLPQMFGQNHYNILTSPVEMLQSLTKLYEKIERT